MPFELMDNILHIDFGFPDVITIKDAEQPPVVITPDPYLGPYEVTSQMEPYLLDTAGKLMTDNLAVMPIQKSVVTNEAGGYTITIGG